MTRNYFDLGHAAARVGKLGRIQTISWIPVSAGDSLEISLNGYLRMSPMRRKVILDNHYAIHCFYVPHRHVYGEQWHTFIEDGVDETVTFPDSGTLSAAQVPIWLKRDVSTTVPKFLSAGYNQIWNRYYRDPRDDLELPDTWTPAHAGNTGRPSNWTSMDGNAKDSIEYGYLAGRLESMSSDLNAFSNLAGADREVQISSNKFDLVSLDQVKARYRGEVERDWFNRRYTDILGATWGTGVNIDADQRPELLYSHDGWLSGMDIDATDDAGLGRVLGKSTARIGFSMPRRFFNEHGCVWILMVLRGQPIFSNEQHYLLKKANPSYLEFGCEPRLMAAQPPVSLNAQDIYAGGGNVDLGLMPYGDYWRRHPANVHPDFDEVQGYPFIENTPANKYQASYCRSEDWDDMFQTSQLKHWNLIAQVGVGKYTQVPSGQSSIFAGA